MKATVQFTGERWQPDLCVWRREPQRVEVDLDDLVKDFLIRQGEYRFPIMNHLSVEIVDGSATGTSSISE